MTKIIFYATLFITTYCQTSLAGGVITVDYKYLSDESLRFFQKNIKYNLTPLSEAAPSLFDDELLNPVRDVFKSQGWVESSSPDVVIYLQRTSVDSSRINDELHYEIKGPTGISESTTSGVLNHDGTFNASTTYRQTYGPIGSDVFSLPRNRYSVVFRFRAIDANTRGDRYPKTLWDLIITSFSGDPDSANHLRAGLIATQGLLGTYGDKEGRRDMPVTDAMSWNMKYNPERELDRARNNAQQHFNLLPKDEQERIKTEANTRVKRYLEALDRGVSRDDALKILLPSARY